MGPARGGHRGGDVGGDRDAPEGHFGVVVVDVRTREDYDGGHIENTVLVPNESIGSEMPETLPDKEATLLIYCRSGRRRKDAAQKLLALGYQSVYDFGGVIDWPYELVKEG